MLVGDSVHERLVELVVTIMLTVPEPFTANTVMVEVAGVPAMVVIDTGLMDIAKSDAGPGPVISTFRNSWLAEVFF